MLAVEQLCFSYPGRLLLNSVSFLLRDGAVTCLLGGNGAGKTTLFNLISGFLRPDAGFIRLGQVTLNGKPSFRISRLGVSRTFQDLRLIGKLTVRENVLLAIPSNPGERLGRALLPSNSDRNLSDHRKADAILIDYFLGELADQAASDISYGQQKLLTLACCAAMDASLLLLDEPVAGISPEYRDRVAERLDRLKAAGKTILLIEHQPDFLERTGDTFLYLQGGQVHRFDTLAALRAAPFAHDVVD